MNTRYLFWGQNGGKAIVICFGQGCLSGDEWHGCPGDKGARADLAGAEGGTNAVGDQVPYWIDQLLGLITPFRPPVYRTSHARVVNVQGHYFNKSGTRDRLCKLHAEGNVLGIHFSAEPAFCNFDACDVLF